MKPHTHTKLLCLNFLEQKDFGIKNGKLFKKGLEQNPNYQNVPLNHNQTLLEEENIDIDGKTFPLSIVKKWRDFNINSEIGTGNFGKVYQGYLHLNAIQR